MAEAKKTLERTRAEHDARWGAAVPAVRAGRRLGALVAGAKAYLGQYLNLQEEVEGEARVGMIFNPPLAEAVLDGLVAALDGQPPPRPEDIARDQLAGREMPLGYVFLAGADLRVRALGAGALLGLPEAVRRALCCYALAVPTDHVHGWEPLLWRAEPALTAHALWQYWQPFLAAGHRRPPGLYRVLGEPGLRAVAARLLLPVLGRRRAGDWRGLRELLAAALSLADRSDLLALVRQAAGREGAVPRERVHWLAAGFLLAPGEFAGPLAAYCGHSKEKILPLLDFVAPLLGPGGACADALSDRALAQLLRIIGPVFPPAAPEAGAEPDRISLRVSELFRAFQRRRGPEAEAARAWLRSIRVMRRCAAALGGP